jgi:hypothetical protein
MTQAVFRVPLGWDDCTEILDTVSFAELGVYWCATRGVVTVVPGDSRTSRL